jgi:hypothetical protein
VSATSKGKRRAARRVPTVVLVVSLMLAVAGGAFAYWRALGSGSASAATGTTASLTISPATVAAQLYPGGQADVVLTLTNPGSASVRVGSLAVDTSQGTNGYAVDGAHSGCAVSALTFTTQTNGGAGWTVPGSGSLPVTLANALSMTTAAANACQGASFSVYLRVAS